MNSKAWLQFELTCSPAREPVGHGDSSLLIFHIFHLNNIKARINKTQQNSKCRLCGDRDEIIHHILNECSKLRQMEYKTRHD